MSDDQSQQSPSSEDRPWNADVPSCPACGALVSLQRDRCHHCGRPLRGSAFDAVFFDLLVPRPFASAPGTTLIAFMIVGWYVAIALATAGDSLAVMGGYTARLFGSLDSSWVRFGEYWRVLSSVFLHHDLLHLAFNLYALAIAGPIFERFYGPRRLVAVFTICGAASMAASFAWSQLTWFSPSTYHQSLGASGAICALIGANLVAAWKLRRSEQATFKRMLVWIAFLMLIGFGFSGGRLDNAAHIGGLVAGAVAGAALRLRGRDNALPSTFARVGWSVTMYAALAAALLVMGLGIWNTRETPTHLERDGYPRSLLFIQISDGATWELSSQVQFDRACRDAILGDDVAPPQAVESCRLDALANAHDFRPWLMYAESLKQAGTRKRSRRALAVSEHLRSQ